ncbi:MAG: hypothetical protein RLY71_3089 [Pseudomonadota bacterium]|jgi:hypothetical protein
MNYTNRSVADLVKGPLVHTPQGWIVMLTICIYAAYAVAHLLGTAPIQLTRSREAELALCVFWPCITCLFFVRHNLPDFTPSWSRAAQVAACAVAPLLAAVW